MLISEFDYELPEELIAQHPAGARDASRMLVVEKARGVWRDAHFAELPSFINRDDLLVINNTRVFPARLQGRREPTGGRVELFLIRERASLVWEALARPARRLQVGALVSFGDGRLRARIIETLEEGRRLVRFEAARPLESLFEELGETPLPPYIRREAGAKYQEDRERYQTIYAQRSGAIAAPTAGLHFTERVMQKLRERGARFAEVTLHVGYGTFEPVRVEDLSEHRVAAEPFEITVEAAQMINETRQRGGRIIAVGTTTTRALETAAGEDGQVRACASEADLTITPGYQFRAVDALITNFHLPRSSLLVLVSTFAGRELIRAAYEYAVRSRYRFYSYGDCMLII
jgi:S-adenosylmethionine:tRNA ribosyltransferase-isomerase